MCSFIQKTFIEHLLSAMPRTVPVVICFVEKQSKVERSAGWKGVAVFTVPGKALLMFEQRTDAGEGVDYAEILGKRQRQKASRLKALK